MKFPVFLPLLLTLSLSKAAVAADPWTPIPLLPPEAAAAGISPGGEGGQWPRYDVSISETDPNFMLLPIDVGGLYRTEDGGARWRPAMTGWNARGANSFAIDPRNPDHVLGVGGNSLNWNALWGQSPHGVYRSTDKARSWHQTLAVPEGKLSFVAIDPSSYDAEKNFCTVAYFAGYASGLFRSEDGGETWKSVNRLPIDIAIDPNTSAFLKIHPTSGAVYLAGKGGFYRSEDGGKTFEQTYRDGDLAGLAVSKAEPDHVWISGANGLALSTDAGKSFKPLAAKGVVRKPGDGILNVNVSPADPARMLCWVAGADFDWVRYVSHDGGASFEPIKVDVGVSGRESNNGVPGGFAFLPYNVRNGYFAWHPTDPEIVYGLGGDWVTRSTDGGKSFHWWNNGYNGVMLGTSFNFSATHPDVVFLAFQDYNGAFTTDQGKTWSYRDVSGKGWGGHCYGGHAVDDQVMWYGDSEDWGSPRRTRISTDGGTTWDFAKGPDGELCEWKAEVSYSDPKDPNILFASCWRSPDKGKSWARMEDCDGVFISAPDGTLIGKKDDAIVTSKDGGASWQMIAEIEGGFRDVAYDHRRDRYYVTSEGRLKTWENGALTTLETPKDQYGNVSVEAVAVDAAEPEIVYAGGPKNLYASHATIIRSTDGAATWENLTTGEGPHEVHAIRVHPVTREAWLNGQCYGMWKIAAPTELGAASGSPDATPAPKVAVVETIAPVSTAEKLEFSKLLRDFNDGGLEYTFGKDWKNNANVKNVDGSLRILTTENGGGGMVLGGVNLTPSGETHLLLRARLLPGNAATTLNAKVITEGKDAVEVAIPLDQLSETEWTLLAVPMGEGDLSNVGQIQLQGANFSDGAGPLRVDIDAFGTALLPGNDTTLALRDGAAADVKLALPPPPAANPGDDDVTFIIRDFGPAGVDYTFGEDWKNNENVNPSENGLLIDSTEFGGAGVVLNQIDVAPQGQDQLALRLRALPGNVATKLSVNVMRSDADGGKASYDFDLTAVDGGGYQTLVRPLGAGSFKTVDQIQFQGTNWGGGKAILKLEIDLIGTNSSDSETNATAREAKASDPASNPPEPDKPDVAGWGFYPDFPGAWMGRHQGFLERTAAAKNGDEIGVLFLGDSLTQGWGDTGKETWDRDFAPLGAENYGIGGDSTRQILWRIENGEIDGLSPKLVVLNVGTNNLYGDFNAGTDEEIAAGISKIVAQLREKLPDAKILLLGILPRQNDFFSNRTSHINELIAPLADDEAVRFLDASDQFQTEIGQMKPELYQDDQLHLRLPGYEVWAAAMLPVVNEMLGKK